MSIRFYIGHLVPNYIFTISSEGTYHGLSEIEGVARKANLIVEVKDDSKIIIIKDRRFMGRHSTDWISEKQLTMLRMGLLPKHIKEAYVTNINFNYKYNSQFNIV
jgi:hypothetical protein